MPVKATRGPDGGITYTNDRWSVRVGASGEIAVARGDWLSKYSAALYDNFWQVKEYARSEANGNLVPVMDPNLIHAGETLHHIPTWNKANAGGTSNFKPLTITGVTKPEREQITEEATRRELDLPGDTGIVGGFIKWSGRILGPAAGAAKLVEVGGLLTVGPAGTLAMGVAGPIAMCVGYMFSIVSAMSFGMKLFALKGSAYTTTAWAFGEAPPRPPPADIARVTTAHANNAQWWRQKYETSWMDVRKQTLANIDNLLNQKGIRKEDWQVALRACAEDDPKKLASRLYAATGEKVSSLGTERTQHQLYGRQVDYPN